MIKTTHFSDEPKKSGGRRVEGNLFPSTPNVLKDSEVEGVEGKIDINMKRAFQ